MRIGVDLGGTKIEALAIDADGRERSRRRIASPAGDYDRIVSAVAGLVAAIEADVGSRASVGLGIPGSISPATGLVRNANSTVLNGRPFARDVSAAIGREVRVENDANCFALSEASDGAGAGHRVVFGVILGTGVGGGIVVDGRIWHGAQAIAGEWGHNPLPWRPGSDDGVDDEAPPALPCWCGRCGCIECFLSGPGLARDHARRGGDALDARAIAALANAGDAAARATLGRHAERLARALAAVVNVLDPDVVVLGGGLSLIDELYREVPRRLARHVFSDRCDTRVAKNVHGDASGVRGAAWLWP